MDSVVIQCNCVTKTGRRIASSIRDKRTKSREQLKVVRQWVLPKMHYDDSNNGNSSYDEFVTVLSIH